MPATLLGAPNVRSSFPSLLELGLRKVWTTQYPLYDTGIIEQFYTVAGSVKRQETDVVTAGLGSALPTAEGESPVYDNLQEVWKTVFVHSKFTLGLEFTEESIEDNLYLQLVEQGGKELAMTMAYTRQVQAMDIWNDLTKAVFTVGSTNYSLLGSSLPLVNGSTWANRPVIGTGLSIEAVEERLSAWTIGMLDQRGRKMHVQPAILMVGATDRFLAERITNTDRRPQSNNNDVNAVRSQFDLQPLVNPHLTDDGRWFLIAPKQYTALVQFDRVAPGPPRRYDSFDNGNLKLCSRMRLSHGAAHVSGLMGSPGS